MADYNNSSNEKCNTDEFNPLRINSNPLDSIYKTTVHLIDDNILHFKNDDSEPGQRLHSGFRALRDGFLRVSELAEKLKYECSSFDFSPEVPGSGFRSFSSMVQQAVIRVFEISKQISTSRDSIILFRKGYYMKEIEAWGQTLASLSTLLEYLTTVLLPQSKDGNLIPESDESPMELLSLLNMVSQYSFYGRCLGFHYHESLWKTLKFLNISLCAFSEVYYSDGSFMQRTKQSLLTGGKYVMDPELRARRLVDVVQYSSVEFIKSFWSLADTELLAQLPSIVCPSLAVEQTVIVPCESMEIINKEGKLVVIEAPHSYCDPSPITCYLLSSVLRQGMPGEKGQKGSQPPSPHIIFHCHGGGFVSQSTKAQQVFLRGWSSCLGVPIFSVDYSLAPEAKYPRALEDVLTSYVWMLNNMKLLGSTGAKIVATGDSAGGNLVTSLTVKCLELGIRPPDGLFLAYTPFVIKITASPSRLLAIMDPMLPLGFALRCLKAYAGAPSNRTSLVNSPGDGSFSLSSPPNTDVPSEELPMSKRFEKGPTKQSTEVESDPESIGGVSQQDGVGDDAPLESCKGIEIDTMTTVSLNSDTATKADEGKTEEVFMESREEKSRKYVTEFLEKYVLDSRVDKQGKEVQILRTGSEDIDEENIVYEMQDKTGISAKFGKAKEAVLDGISAGLSSIKFLKKDKSVSEESPPESKSNGVRKSSFGRSPLVKNELCRQDSCSLLEDFADIVIASDHYLNPLTTPGETLKKFPPVTLMTVEYDFCLDDCVMMAKKLRSLDVPVTLDVLDRLPHGFLNLCLVSREAHDGYKLSITRLRNLFGGHDEN